MIQKMNNRKQHQKSKIKNKRLVLSTEVSPQKNLILKYRISSIFFKTRHEPIITLQNIIYSLIFNGERRRKRTQVFRIDQKVQNLSKILCNYLRLFEINVQIFKKLIVSDELIMYLQFCLIKVAISQFSKSSLQSKNIFLHLQTFEGLKTFTFDFFIALSKYFERKCMYQFKRQKLYIHLILIMQKTDQELYDIADSMLANLQKQYWQTQQHNIKFDQECPQNNQNLDEGYQLLDGDEQNNNLNDSQSEEDNQEENQGKKEQNQEVSQQAGINQASPAIHMPVSQQKQAVLPQQNESEELMQVFPMPEWVPQAKEVNINCEKIKQFTLTMNLPIPEWVNNQDMLKNRIMELFGKKN